MSSTQSDSPIVVTLNSNRVQQEILVKTLSLTLSGQTKNDHGSRRNVGDNEDDIVTKWSTSSPFQTKFAEELHRVTTLVNKLQVDIELSAKALLVRADALSKQKIRDVQESYSQLHQLKIESRKNVEDSITLQQFFTSSRNILLDIASHADKVGKHTEAKSCTSLVYQRIPKIHLNSSLVCVTSDIHSALRKAEEKILNTNNHPSGADVLWEAPSSFKRSTTKYWVKDEDLTKLMMICAVEAPLLVYGKKGPLTSLKSRDLTVPDGDKLWNGLATRITSVYFDSQDMKLYCSRLKREEGAQLLRARWYGPSMPIGDKHIFLELKTHHEKWVTQKSVKERATIMERHMVYFLQPTQWDISYAEELVLKAKPKLKHDAVELSKQAGLLLRMHNLVVKHNLTACVRSVYDRAAFQSAKSNDFRLTLDRNVTLINERAKKEPNGWCLSDSDAKQAPAKVVPFNVFETKLASNASMPCSLVDAETDQTMVLATKFSKFITGAAAFNAIPTLPYWAADPSFYYFFDLDKRGDHQVEDGNQGAYTLMDAPSNDNHPASKLKLQRGIVIAPKNPPRIEPTTYFSNERTFVQWVSSAMLLLSVSGFMLNAGHDYDTTAAMIALAALVLLVVSTTLYFKRLYLLAKREPYGYFNKINPMFLASVTGFAIFLVLANSIRGSEFIGKGKRRHLSQSMLRRQLSRKSSTICPEEVFRTHLSIKEKPTSFTVDHERHSFLMTSNDSVYIQSKGFALDTTSAKPLIRINQSHLKGVAIVGDRLFTVSSSPGRNELIEMTWWGSASGDETLRIMSRWTLDDPSSTVEGFNYLPSPDGVTIGHLYIKRDSSMHVYTMPTETNHPMRLKSINMKVLGHGMESHDKTHSPVKFMTVFEGITYILGNRNILEAWNMTDGTILFEIELPSVTNEIGDAMQWTCFALERSTSASTVFYDVGNGNSQATISSNELILHLMTDDHISSFRVLDNTIRPFAFPLCQSRTSSADQDSFSIVQSGIAQ